LASPCSRWSREPDDFNEAFSVMTADMPDAILMVADALTILIETGLRLRRCKKAAGDLRV